MIKSKDFKEIVSETDKLLKKFSSMKNLNEVLSFNDEYAVKSDEMESEESLDNSSIETVDSVENTEINEYDTIISDIRKMAINGVSKLSDDVDNPTYQTLKKIWSLCEKKPTDLKDKEIE